MTTSFYSAFEQRFRGPRELIVQRLEAYVPFLRPLAALHTGAPVLDLGCGRGEWLELTRKLGLSPFGVDLDAGMLAECERLGLPVHRGDALEFLKTVPDSSQAAVSAFHLVEHLSFEQVLVLIAEALRVLRPGGLLIVETPNSENLLVGASFFYVDPTHERPVHGALLSFLVEHAGFARSKLLGLNEDSELKSRKDIGIYEVLSGVSPDAAVIAQKGGGPGELAVLNDAFCLESGVSLLEVSKQYEEGLARRLDALSIDLTTNFSNRLSAHDRSTQERIDHVARELENLRIEVIKLQLALAAIQGSRSWRWTAPARRLNAAIRPTVGKVLRRSLAAVRGVLSRHPRARTLARRLLGSSPPLARFVSRFLATPAATVEPVVRFEDLHSARLMHAVAELPGHSESVTFLEPSNLGR